MSVQYARRLIDVREYHRMVEADILTEKDRVELINGEIIEMSPIGSKHAAIVDRISNTLMAHLAGRAIVRVQSPVQIDGLSEPEPDIVLLRTKADFYAQEHPRPEDIILLIEVADISLTYDREIKLPLYAKAGIPEFWLVDLEKMQLEAYRNPQGESYASQEIFKSGKPVKLHEWGLAIEAGQLLG